MITHPCSPVNDAAVYGTWSVGIDVTARDVSARDVSARRNPDMGREIFCRRLRAMHSRATKNPRQGHPPKLLVATTVPESAWSLLRGQLADLREHGYAVTLLSSPGQKLEATSQREGVRPVAVPMEREIRLLADAVALWRSVRVLLRERPDISMMGTPKASLLVGLASAVTGVPHRVYLLRGLRLETSSGFQRLVLWLCERLAAACAHEVVAVSPSLLARARTLRTIPRSKGIVLGRGGSNGVPVPIPSPDTARRRGNFRRIHGLGEEDVVFAFAGRLMKDKGTVELIDAFVRVAESHPAVALVVAGSAEGTDLPHKTLRILSNHSKIKYTGWLEDTAELYAAMDVLVLPTYREGFPTVCLEASAAGHPVITTHATGARDAVLDGETGMLVPVADAAALAEAMARLACDADLRLAMGRGGREFVRQHFSHDVVWSNIRSFLAAGPPDKRLSRRSSVRGVIPQVEGATATSPQGRWTRRPEQVK